jgi:hypothetical protein
MLAGMTRQFQTIDRRIMGSSKQSAPQPFGDDIIRNGDTVCAIEGSFEVPLNVWNDVTQEDALGAWDHFRGSRAICH